MERIFLTLLLSSMFIASAYGQRTTFSMGTDGSGRFLVEEPGDAPPKQFRLSPKALDFTLQIALDEVFEGQIRGTSINYLENDDSKMAVTQTLIGMTSKQVTQMAQKRFELYENTKDETFDALEQLVHFDDLSPEEILALKEQFRNLSREDLENARKIYEEVLAPEQLQQLAELELVENLNNDFPTLNPRAYASLGLSDKQQEELANLLRESKAEIKEAMLALIREMPKLVKEVFASYIASNEDASAEEIEALLQTLPPEEMKKIEDKIQALGEKNLQKQKTTGERFAKKINELLTPQQREKYVNLKKELSAKLERIRKEQTAKQKDKKPEDYEWLKSWKPGDPVPEGAVPPLPPSRFPRALL
jgi:hypothetical protein